jgi:hypothetical protein
MYALSRLLIPNGLTVQIDQRRREVLARQPGLVDRDDPTLDAAPRVALSQAVRLARSRQNPGALAWMLRVEDGFRGQGGALFEHVAAGDDLEQVARVLCKILAVATTAPDPAVRPAP